MNIEMVIQIKFELFLPISFCSFDVGLWISTDVLCFSYAAFYIGDPLQSRPGLLNNAARLYSKSDLVLTGAIAFIFISLFAGLPQCILYAFIYKRCSRDQRDQRERESS